MALVTRAWSKGARLQRRIRNRRQQREAWEEGRFDWVRQHARGKSFADIGGMFKLVGDMAFLAEEVGATQVTMFDVGDPDLPCEGHEDWGNFADKRRQRGSQVRYVQGDLEDPASPERIGVHDVVFYSGVLYHTPNPVRHLMQLREITAELLFISTLTIPEIPGFPHACVYYPHLDEDHRRPFAAGYSWGPSLLGIGAPIDERPMYGYGNCFWGITPSALDAMLRTARFEVIHARALPIEPYATELVCRPLPADPLLPPVTYFRERGEALERGEGRMAFADHYLERRIIERDERRMASR